MQEQRQNNDLRGKVDKFVNDVKNVIGDLDADYFKSRVVSLVESSKKKETRADKFVKHIIDLVQQDKGARAALKYADHPSLGYKSWSYLADFINIEDKNELLSYGLVASSVAKYKNDGDDKDGGLNVGKALRACYDKGDDGKKQAESKLLRLLSCESVEELCLALRNYISLIESKNPGALSYSRLLKDLCYFGEQTKIRWTRDFYYDPKGGGDGGDKDDADAN